MLTIALLRRWFWVRVPANPISVSNPSFPREIANEAICQAIEEIPEGSFELRDSKF